jgi:hypothetical protein
MLLIEPDPPPLLKEIVNFSAGRVADAQILGLAVVFMGDPGLNTMIL